MGGWTWEAGLSFLRVAGPRTWPAQGAGHVEVPSDLFSERLLGLGLGPGPDRL